MRAKTLSRLAVALFWLSLAIAMVLETFLDAKILYSFEYRLFSSILSLTLIVLWVEADAVARRITIRKRLRYLIVFAPPIGIPVYVIRSRGLLGFLRFSGWFALCAAVWVALCGGLAALDVI